MTTQNGVTTQTNRYKDVLDKLLAHGDFTYGKQAELDAAVSKVLNPEKFSYDPVSDPAWGSYQQIYRREGDRAARNALARASVATGGVPSSYAVSAAQQAQNYYNGQMADMLPTLQQNAYQKYLDDYDRSLTGLSTLLSDRDSQYGLWQGGYDKLQSDLAALEAQQNAEYQKQQNAYGNLLTLITTTGFVPDADALAAAGMSAEEAAAWKAYYDKANGVKTTSSKYSGDQYDQAMVKAIQTALGNVAVDGVWGSQTSNAALQKWGTTDPYKIYELIKSQKQPTTPTSSYYDGISDAGKKFLSTSVPAAPATDAWKTEVNKRAAAAVNAGEITQSDYDAIVNKLGIYTIL